MNFLSKKSNHISILDNHSTCLSQGFRGNFQLPKIILKHLSFGKQGWKKMPYGCQGQVDFPAGPITFQSHLPMCQGTGKSFANLIKKKRTKTCPGQAKFQSCLSLGQAGIQVMFSPVKNLI